RGLLPANRCPRIGVGQQVCGAYRLGAFLARLVDLHCCQLRELELDALTNEPFAKVELDQEAQLLRGARRHQIPWRRAVLASDAEDQSESVVSGEDFPSSLTPSSSSSSPLKPLTSATGSHSFNDRSFGSMSAWFSGMTVLPFSSTTAMEMTRLRKLTDSPFFLPRLRSPMDSTSPAVSTLTKNSMRSPL